MRSNYAVLLILLSLLICLGVSQKSHATTEFAPFSYYDSEVCILGKDAVTCVRPNLVRKKISFPRPLKNPRMITSNSIHICVVDDQGLSCLRKETYINHRLTDLTPPTIANKIKQLVSDRETTCALSEDVLKKTYINCWGKPASIPSDISSVKSISINDQETVCALNDLGTFCRGVHHDMSMQTKKVPLNFAPKKLTAGPGITCAFNSNNIQCWGLRFYGKQTQIPTLLHPTAVALGYAHSCAIDSDEVKCWGENYKELLDIPPITNPKHIITSDNSTCVSTYHEVICWGLTGTFAVPLENTILDLNFADQDIYDSLNRISLLSNPIKNKFFSELAKFGKMHLNMDSNKSAANKIQVQYGTYLLLSLLKPAITSGDSEHFIKSIIPALERGLNSRGKELDITNINAISFQSDLLKLTALKVIQSSILLGKDFLSLQDQKQLSNILKALGQSLAKPTQMNITTLLNEMNSQNVLFEKLNQSPKTAFLYDTISLASLYLEKQVQ